MSNDLSLKKLPSTIDQILEFAEENDVIREAREQLQSAIKAYLDNVNQARDAALDSEMVGKISLWLVRIYAEVLKDEETIAQLDGIFSIYDWNQIAIDEEEVFITSIDMRTGKHVLFIRYEKDGPIYIIDCSSHDSLGIASLYLSKIAVALDGEEDIVLDYTLVEEKGDGSLVLKAEVEPIDKSHLN